MNNLASSSNNGPEDGLAWKPNLSGNSVSWNGSAVVKSYGSKPDNYYREYAILKKLENIPLPHVLDSSIPGQLHMNYIDGIGGKEAIEAGHAASLLKEMGIFLRQLHAIPIKILDDILQGEGSVIVHGDFAYYNCIMSKESENILAVIDWEEAYIGDAVTDLAWCEWQFRNKYPQHSWAISNLFNGYGSTPDWDLRQEAIRVRLNELQNRT